MSSIARTIKITSLPHGDADEWVRAAWIGCTFPTASLECGHVPVYVESVVPRRRKGLLTAAEFLALPQSERWPEQIAGYSVDQIVALEVLKEHNPKARAWWVKNGFPKNDPNKSCFRFKRNECLVLETYSDAELQKYGNAPVCRSL